MRAGLRLWSAPALHLGETIAVSCKAGSRRGRRDDAALAYFFAEVTMNGEAEAGAVFLSALGLRTSLLDFF